jgi:hypothetical protein
MDKVQKNNFTHVGFEVLTAVSTKMFVFWVAATHRPDDGGSKDLWNVGKLLPDYTALQPRRQPSSILHILLKYVF